MRYAELLFCFTELKEKRIFSRNFTIMALKLEKWEDIQHIHGVNPQGSVEDLKKNYIGKDKTTMA